jgi:outer membrane protein TolC
MRARLKFFAAIILATWLPLSGCRSGGPSYEGDTAYFQARARDIEYPDVETPVTPGALDTPPPWILTGQPPPMRPITLQEAIQIALTHSTVLRDTGGLLLQSPGTIQTTINPAIVETDPRFGIEGALSEFDAQLAASATFEKNDRQFNSILQGGGPGGLFPFQQDLNIYTAELRKRTATGTGIAVRTRYAYDFNNSPFNNDPNLPWTALVEGEVRQPLLQGNGIDFNRIAGPSGVPGVYRGVLIARVNTDVSLADFEAAVIQLISDVENAYWELYFAYRDLDAKLAARRQAYDTWRQIHVLFDQGPGGQLEASAEAQAREQLYRLEAEAQDALVGRQREKSNTNVFRGGGGVYYSERQLRSIIGLPATDGDLLRPADEPTMTRNVFSWQEMLPESLVRRVELRRQKWMVKRRELELIAARNFLLPKVDVVALYRFRGTGHDLIGNSMVPFDNAVENMVSGDFQEWVMGVEMLSPIGFRQGHAAMRQAELLLMRERSVLEDQERQVVSDLSDAVSELDRAYEIARTQYNRRLAALRQLETLGVLLEQSDNIEKPRLLDLQLDAQRRLADSESQFYRSLAEHEVAIKNVHREKGTLLDYNRIYLAEGPWPGKAYDDAARRARLWIGTPGLENFVRDDRLVSAGAFPQQSLPPGSGGDPQSGVPPVVVPDTGEIQPPPPFDANPILQNPG